MTQNKKEKGNQYFPDILVKIKSLELKEQDRNKGIYRYGNYSEAARKYLKKHRHEVFFWRLNQPLVFLEKRCWEPLDDWIKRSAIFSIAERSSPIVESVGVILGAILIPVAILGITIYVEDAKDRRAAQVKTQEAIKSYMAQVIQVFLEGDLKKEGEKNDDLRKAIRSITLVILDGPNLNDDNDEDFVTKFLSFFRSSKKEKKGKRAIISFLYNLNLIQGDEDYENPPIISLKGANLSKADFSKADLSTINLKETILNDANLSRAILFGATLKKAELKRASLTEIDFIYTNLTEADLSEGDLSNAILYGGNFKGANLKGANLKGAYLEGANLDEVKNLTLEQIKLSCNWGKAVYTEASWSDLHEKWIAKDKKANQVKINEIKNDEASEPKKPPECDPNISF